MTSFVMIQNNGVKLTNKINFSNYCFNSILLLFYMFLTPYVHHQEGLIVHAVLYGINAWKR